MWHAAALIGGGPDAVGAFSAWKGMEEARSLGVDPGFPNLRLAPDC